MKQHIFEIKLKPGEMEALLELIDLFIDGNQAELQCSLDIAKENIPWREAIKSELAILRKLRHQLKPQVKRALGEK